MLWGFLRCFTVWSPDGKLLSQCKDSCVRFYYIVAAMIWITFEAALIFLKLSSMPGGAQMFQKSRRYKWHEGSSITSSSKYIGRHCAQLVHPWRGMPGAHKCSKKSRRYKWHEGSSIPSSSKYIGRHCAQLVHPWRGIVGGAVHQLFSCGLPSWVIRGCELRAAQMMLQMVGYRNGQVVRFGNLTQLRWLR